MSPTPFTISTFHGEPFQISAIATDRTRVRRGRSHLGIPPKVDSNSLRLTRTFLNDDTRTDAVH
jgi:hypothetical protein